MESLRPLKLNRSFSALFFVIHLVSCFDNSIPDLLATPSLQETRRELQHINDLPSSSENMAVAHLGNSMQYKNDCPRMLEHLMKLSFEHYHQDSVFRGGANITTLFLEGNGMESVYNTSAALKPDGAYDIGAPNVLELMSEREWSAVVINDYSQTPAREKSRKESIKTLKEEYLPLVGNATVILLLTPAYLSPVKNSSDLGDFDSFTNLLLGGYQEYAKVFPNVKIAPVGLAYQYIRNNLGNETWAQLYAEDDYHPSLHGTYLEANVLYCTIVGEEPPSKYNKNWWQTSRLLTPNMPVPTAAEAKVLRKVASEVCEKFNHINGANTIFEKHETEEEEAEYEWTEDTLSTMLNIFGAATGALLFLLCSIDICKRLSHKKQSENEPKHRLQVRALSEIV